ncbi:MAG: hypothetical protein PHN75_11750 [Syntrophales bacterium]|nr:hypothetical protein [Syntrophales bacterium]
MAERRFRDEVSGAELINKRRRVLNYESRKTTTKWIGIIVIVAIVVIVLINVIPPLFSKLDIADTTYRPRDVERQYHQIQKLRAGEPDQTQKGNWEQIHNSGNYGAKDKW